MKNAITIALIFFSALAFGQKPINGKGEIKTKKFSVEQFNRLEVNLGGNVRIECGKMPLVEVSANENIIQLIEMKEKDGNLYIGSDAWIENASGEVVIHVPFLNEYIHSGWGNVLVTNLDSERFTLRASSGSIRLEGKVDHLVVENTGSGSVRLDKLENRYLEVDQTGSSSLSVYSSDTVFVKRNDGVITYSGEPVVLTGKDVDADYIKNRSEISSAKPVYIDAKIKNNSMIKRNCYIKGPSNANFSYGFPMWPGASRAERVPVGTKIYQVNAQGKRTKLLVEFTAEDDGETIKLYE